jgi:hypothetical protein
METEECDIVPNEKDAYEAINMFTTCKGVKYPFVICKVTGAFSPNETLRNA